MNNQARRIILSIIFCALISSCVPATRYVWKSYPTNPSVGNEFFTAKISPTRCSKRGCKAFNLTVRNNTNENLELDWNKTLFITNGQTSGGFMFEGILYRDRNSPKSPDIIFPGGELSKNIYPNNLVEFYSEWSNEYIPSGNNGVYLTVIVGKKEISEKLLMTLSRTEIVNK